MFPTLPLAVQEEVISLSVRFGSPLVHLAELDVPRLFNPLGNSDRYGEVCMVIRRPNGRLITAKKDFYPTNGYRLLTGGIRYNEAILDALLRETQEETGLEVTVQRFLVAVAYHLPARPEQPLFYTFAFLLEEKGGTLACLDEDERLEYFREISLAELPERALFFNQLAPGYSQDLATDWSAWGRFRAVIHRLVGEALQ